MSNAFSRVIYLKFLLLLFVVLAFHILETFAAEKQLKIRDAGQTWVTK